MYRCSINVYRCAESHKFQAILKNDMKPAFACPRTLLVAKTAGRKNLTRELLYHRVTKFSDTSSSEREGGEGEREIRQELGRKEREEGRNSRNCSNNAK